MATEGAPLRAALLALALLPILAPGLAAAMLTAALKADGWRELTIPNTAENQFSLGQDGAIEVVSRDSASVLYQPVAIDLAQRPILKWRWRVDQAPPATDLTAKGKDDCALAVYVGFPYHSDQASFFERLKRPVIEAWTGADLPGRALRYAFCGQQARGAMFASPYLGPNDMVLVLRPATIPTGAWFEEQVDIAADYRKAFNEAPENPIQLAIQADTDNTHTESRAAIADLTFVPRNAVAEAAQDSPEPNAPLAPSSR